MVIFKEIPRLEKRHSILALSAVELAEKIRKRDITSEELVKVCVERIKAVSFVKIGSSLFGLGLFPSLSTLSYHFASSESIVSYRIFFVKI